MLVLKFQLPSFGPWSQKICKCKMRAAELTANCYTNLQFQKSARCPVDPAICTCIFLLEILWTRPPQKNWLQSCMQQTSGENSPCGHANILFFVMREVTNCVDSPAMRPDISAWASPQWSPCPWAPRWWAWRGRRRCARPTRSSRCRWPWRRGSGRRRRWPRRRRRRPSARGWRWRASKLGPWRSAWDGVEGREN